MECRDRVIHWPDDTRTEETVSARLGDDGHYRVSVQHRGAWVDLGVWSKSGLESGRPLYV